MKVKRAHLLLLTMAAGMAIFLLAVTTPQGWEIFAADPAGGTISSGSPAASWSGGPFALSNPASCSTAEVTCDHYALTIDAPHNDFVVTVRIAARNVADDLDLFVRDTTGATVATSATPSSIEEVTLVNPATGTYTVVVQPFLVSPLTGGVYDGTAGIAGAPKTENSNSYHGVRFTPDFAGVPNSTPAKSSPLVPELKVSFNYVGRQAAEPTIVINANNTAFYAASAFDFPTPGFPQRLARTVVMRSRDKGVTWQPVAGFALSAESLAEPPFTLDPMMHIDPDAGAVDPVTGRRRGRVFSVDLNAACGAQTVFSDDEGDTWSYSPVFGCGQPVNDHHTIATARPQPPGAPGLTTLGYPNLLYFCFNRVADSSCNRSSDGGLTSVPTAPAFLGSDPNAGAVCGGLTGHLAADSEGRIFLPKGHCGLPWVASSDDGGTSWTRVRIAGHTPMDDHEVSLAVDTADNIYAVWQDGTFRLPFLSVSRDHGQTWSTPIVFAPPGVHEVNFPTITAGDPGRIAVLFPGSESAEWDDPARPWNMYVVVSVNALDTDPIFTWTTANDPRDPVHRGSCGPGRCDAEDGGSMFDFLDIQVSPADGMFWGTASDTCVGECITNPQAQKLRPGQGVAIRQVKGPSLFTSR
jgi:hypothetical protein